MKYFALVFFMAWRYSIGHRRDRLSRFISWLSGAGLVLGVAMMITVLSVMNGFDRELREKILVVIPHIKLATDEPIDDWQVVSDRVARHPKVLSVHPYTELQGLIRFRGEVEPSLIYAVNPSLEAQGGFGELLGSDTLSLLEDRAPLEERVPGILLGSGLAKNLGIVEGDSVTLLQFGGTGTALQAAAFPVKRILRTGTEMDQRLALLNLSSLPALQGLSNQPTGLRVQTSELFSTRPLAYELLDQLDAGYGATSWASSHGNLYQAIQMSRNLVTLIVLLILAIAAFNLVATLMIASADKQNELAILKTLGTPPKQLSHIFALQGLIIGSFGALLGALVGIILSSQMTNLTSLIESITGEPLLQTSVYPLDYLPSDIQLGQIVIVVLAAIIMSVLASLFPAWKVSRVNPAEVLRYE